MTQLHALAERSIRNWKGLAWDLEDLFNEVRQRPAWSGDVSFVSFFNSCTKTETVVQLKARVFQELFDTSRLLEAGCSTKIQISKCTVWKFQHIQFQLTKIMAEKILFFRVVNWTFLEANAAVYNSHHCWIKIFNYNVKLKKLKITHKKSTWTFFWWILSELCKKCFWKVLQTNFHEFKPNSDDLLS